MKQTILILSFIIFLFLGYKLPIEPVRSAIDFLIYSVKSEGTEIDQKYIDKCAVQMKNTIEHDLCKNGG